ncbi:MULTISPECIES: hypothetical protein [Lactobacillaceae]|uniref:hypothetical protein n=1 Tax=Lactobacillaceae TaxID=33958 RepID=UPI002430D686|nr:hypothetical protein [Lactobacillus intestinalis]
MTEELMSFLKNDQNFMIVYNERWEEKEGIIKIKNDPVNRFVCLYTTRLEKNFPTGELNFAGLYDSECNRLYYNLFVESIFKGTGNKIHIQRYSKLRDEILEKVGNRVHEYIQIKANTVNTTIELNYQMNNRDEFKRQALEELAENYYEDCKTNQIKKSWIDIDLDLSDCIDYLRNKELYIKLLSDKYLQLKVYGRTNEVWLIEQEKHRRIVDRLKKKILGMKLYGREQEYLFFIQKLAKYKDAKTISVEYQKYDQSLSFKIKNVSKLECGYLAVRGKISDFDIIGRSRETFKTLYGHEDVEIDHINKVTYGRKVIYSKQQSEN